jgi:hypothetical protein
VHRLLREQQQDGGADIAARRPAVAMAVPHRRALAELGAAPAGVVVAQAAGPALTSSGRVHEIPPDVSDDGNDTA